MEAQFWMDRWQQGQIGFHREEIHPGLVHWFPSLTTRTPSNILVPLCGKSRDLLYLVGLGHQVTGIELSHLAIEAFWKETGLTATQRESEALRFFTGPGITLIEGDFFKVRQTDIQKPDLVYDRAALIAMPPDLRGSYVSHLLDLAQDATLLLVTLEYPQDQMAGPPFSVPEEEVMQRFGTRHTIECLESLDVLQDNASIQGRGVTSLRETVYRISPN